MGQCREEGSWSVLGRRAGASLSLHRYAAQTPWRQRPGHPVPVPGPGPGPTLPAATPDRRAEPCPPQLRSPAALPLPRLAGHPWEGASSRLPPSTPGRKHEEDPDLLAAGLPGPSHTKLEGWHAGLLLPCHTASCYTSKEFWLKSKKHYPEKKANCE